MTRFKHCKNTSGFSLVEMAVVLAIISLAFVPIVQLINGQSGDQGNITRVNSIKTKSNLIANTILETALAGDFSGDYGIRCGSTMQDEDWPTATSPTRSYTCTKTKYNQPITYKWDLKIVPGNQATNPDEIVQGNKLYHATLNVYEGTSATVPPVLTLPTYLMQDTGRFENTEESTGIVLSIDTSSSMAWREEAIKNQVSQWGLDNDLAIPYMKYRYRGHYSGPANLTLDKAVNKDLDLVYGQSMCGIPGKDPDSLTEFNEAFPNQAVHNYNANLMPNFDCSVSSDWSATVAKDLFTSKALSNTLDGGFRQKFINKLCENKTDLTQWAKVLGGEEAVNPNPNYDDSNDEGNLSRIEAARTAAIRLLLDFEKNPDITKTVEMGLVTWNDTVQINVPMEKAVSLRFNNMRDRLLWINRFDTMHSGAASHTIGIHPGTNMTAGLLASRDQIRKDGPKHYKNKIIILLSDGTPDGSDSIWTTRWQALQMGICEPDPEKRITIYTVGLIDSDPNMHYVAEATPNGKHYDARTVADLDGIFQNIFYSAQRLALLSKANSYGIEFDNMHSPTGGPGVPHDICFPTPPPGGWPPHVPTTGPRI